MDPRTDQQIFLMMMMKRNGKSHPCNISLSLKGALYKLNCCITFIFSVTLMVSENFYRSLNLYSSLKNDGGLINKKFFFTHIYINSSLIICILQFCIGDGAPNGCGKTSLL